MKMKSAIHNWKTAGRYKIYNHLTLSPTLTSRNLLLIFKENFISITWRIFSIFTQNVLKPEDDPLTET